MFTPLQKILPKAIQRIGLKREIEAALICEKYRKLAPQHIHPEALKHTFPKFYKGKTLTIGVEDSSWAHHIATRKEILLKAINESLGGKGKHVERLQTTIATINTSMDLTWNK